MYIISEDQARKEQIDYILVLPWYFRSVVLSREKGFLDKGIKFIFPLPIMQIVGK